MKDKKILKAGLGYTIGNYFLKGLSFLTIPIFTRLLNIEDYGIYNTFIAYESIFFVIIGFAIHSSFKNAKYKYKDKYEEYVSSSFLLICISLFFWILVSLLFSTVLCKLLNLDKISLIMLVLYSFSNAILQCVNTYFALNYQYKSYLIISFINALGNVLLSILFINTIFSDSRYMGRIFGTVTPCILIAIFIVLKIFKNTKPSFNKSYWKWGLKYSLPIVPHGLSQVILSQFDRIMIQKMIGAAQAGIYSFSYNLYTIISVTTSSLGSVWEPWFYEKMKQKNYDAIRKKSSLYIIGVLLISILLMLISPEIIKIMSDSSYWTAKYCALPIIGAGFFAFLYTLPSTVEYYFEKTKYIALGTMMAALINVVLNYIFLLRFDYVSAAYTTLFTYFIYFIFHYILSLKIFKIKLFSFEIIIFAIITILIAMFFCTVFIEDMIIRWSLFFLIVLFFLIIMIRFLFKKKKEKTKA